MARTGWKPLPLMAGRSCATDGAGRIEFRLRISFDLGLPGLVDVPDELGGGRRRGALIGGVAGRLVHDIAFS